MATTYQTILYKAQLIDFEIGWQIKEDEILFQSQEHEDTAKAMLELNWHETYESNWFATMVERVDGVVTDQEIFDTSVMDTEYKDIPLTD